MAIESTSSHSGPGASRSAREARAFAWISELAALPERAAGTLSEREAARRVGTWMQELGLSEVRSDDVAARPRSGLRLALHAGVAALGVVLGGFPGAALAAFAVISFRREMRDGERLLSRLLPEVASVNVVGRAAVVAPRLRIVLSAHIDAAQAGWIFSKSVADAFARRAQRSRVPGAPPPGASALPDALLVAGALVAGAAWLGAEGALFGLAQFIVGVGLAGVALVGLQWAFAPCSPGANDNASAVAAMLTCAEQLLAQLPADVELTVAGTGAEEVGCRGMHDLLEAHPDWKTTQTLFLNFECVGGGALHYIRTEGTLGKTGYPPMLVELARRVADSGVFGEITPTDLLAGTDGHVPAGRGHPTLSLISLEAHGVPRNYHRMDDLPEHIDTACVVRAADFGAAVLMSALRGDAGPVTLV